MTRAAIVVGAGVSGLSCASRLSDAGFDVRVWARDLTPNTTSDVAAAIWYPYAVEPRDRVVEWGRRTYRAFQELCDVPGSGVALLDGIDLAPEPVEEPYWARAVDGVRHARADELPAGFADGIVARVPRVEMATYMPFLLARVRAQGVRVEVREVEDLREALAESPLVVNCSGLGARELAHDDGVFARRGQVVRVRGVALDRFLLDERSGRGLTYVVPRSADCVLGGTNVLGDESLEPSAADSEAILARCSDLVPDLRGAVVVGTAVGLRPGRAEVRLDAERVDGGVVVHDYGHGGSGVTLSWGCADEVRALAQRALSA